jgi:hypothetical protein
MPRLNEAGHDSGETAFSTALNAPELCVVFTLEIEERAGNAGYGQFAHGAYAPIARRASYFLPNQREQGFRLRLHTAVSTGHATPMRYARQ